MSGDRLGIRRLAQGALAAMVLVACSGEVELQFEPPRTMRPQQAGAAFSPQGIAIDELNAVASRRVGRSVFEYDYAVTLRNDGAGPEEIYVQLTGAGAGTTVVDGAMEAGIVAGGGTATPADRITIRHDRTQPFLADQLQWKIDLTAGRFTGTAAGGSAARDGRLSFVDGNGDPACVEAQIVTDGDGDYVCRVLKSTQPPYVVRAAFPSGFRMPLFSAATEKPGAGNARVVNLTPLTTAILRKLAPNEDNRGLLRNPSLLTAGAIAEVLLRVRTQLAPALALLGLGGDFDPFSTPIVAATAQRAGNAADRLLDVVKIARVDGRDVVYTIDAPQAAVDFALPAPNPDILPPPSAGAIPAAGTVQQLVARLRACLQKPTRALAVDATIPPAQGGPKVLDVVDACKGIWADDYLDNGYTWGQRQYRLLTDPALTGAEVDFEILRHVDGADGSLGASVRSAAPTTCGTPPVVFTTTAVNIRAEGLSEQVGDSLLAVTDSGVDCGNRRTIDLNIFLNINLTSRLTGVSESLVDLLGPDTETGLTLQFGSNWSVLPQRVELILPGTRRIELQNFQSGSGGISANCRVLDTSVPLWNGPCERFPDGSYRAGLDGANFPNPPNLTLSPIWNAVAEVLAGAPPAQKVDIPVYGAPPKVSDGALVDGYTPSPGSRQYFNVFNPLGGFTPAAQIELLRDPLDGAPGSIKSAGLQYVSQGPFTVVINYPIVVSQQTLTVVVPPGQNIFPVPTRTLRITNVRNYRATVTQTFRSE